MTPRWTSRKFITALLAQLAALAVLLWPRHADFIAELATTLTALLVLLLSSLGYLAAEASVDRARAHTRTPPPSRTDSP